MEWLWTIAILVGLVGLSLLAWSIQALDAIGAVAAFALGAFVALAGGVGWLALLSLFTVIGVFVTALGRRRKLKAGTAQERSGERGLRNVVANGLAAALAVAALWLVPEQAAALAFATAIAVVTADTAASEVGGLWPKARRVLPPFRPSKPGENGAVSWLGQLAAAIGALAIGWACVPLLDLNSALAWIPALGGFVGCQLDSLLGAAFEGDGQDGRLDNEGVNFLASAIPALVVLVLASVV